MAECSVTGIKVIVDGFQMVEGFRSLGLFSSMEPH